MPVTCKVVLVCKARKDSILDLVLFKRILGAFMFNFIHKQWRHSHAMQRFDDLAVAHLGKFANRVVRMRPAPEICKVCIAFHASPLQAHMSSSAPEDNNLPGV